MRNHAIEQPTAARRTLTTLGVAGLIVGTSLFMGAGTAAATTTATKCSGTVSGPMGDAVKMKSDAVEKFVVESVEGGFDLLGIVKSNKTRMQELFDAGKFDPISLTTVPKAAAGKLSDDKIALAVVKKIEANEDGKKILGENDNKDNVLGAVKENCGDLTVKATNYVAPTTTSPSTGTTNPGTVTPGTKTPGGSSSSGVPGTSLKPGALPEYGTGSARAPRRDYGGLPFTVPGALGSGGLYGSGSSDGSKTQGLSGDFGVLGAQETPVSNAGNAEAIEAGSPQAEIQLPMLLAVVSLACVAAALVRTWVLRRV